MIIIYNQQGYCCGGERRTVTDDFAPSVVCPEGALTTASFRRRALRFTALLTSAPF
jgi:hypothetical protein